MGCISAQKQKRLQKPNPFLQNSSTQKKNTGNYPYRNQVTRPVTSSHSAEIYSSNMNLPRQENHRMEHIIYDQPQRFRQGQREFSEAHSEISQALQQIERRREGRSVGQVQDIHQFQRRVQGDDSFHQFQMLFYLFRLLRTQSNLSEEQHMILFIRLLQILGSSSQSQGLNQQEIKKLQIRNAKNNDEICAVCQESIKIGEKILILPCKHGFHPQCINPWLQKSDKCPMCRHSIRRN